MGHNSKITFVRQNLDFACYTCSYLYCLLDEPQVENNKLFVLFLKKELFGKIASLFIGSRYFQQFLFVLDFCGVL